MASTSAPSSTAAERGLSVEGLSYRYADGSEALSGVNLSLEPGQVVALVGENGSGKSTLLKLCAGRLLPTLGHARWSGGASDVGYAAQDPELDPDMSGRELLTLWCALTRVRGSERARRIEQLVETFRLTGFVADRVNTYSGGMKRRLHLALSAVHEPGLWLLDEPSSGLDAQTEGALWREAKARAAHGALVLVASHDAGAVAEHMNRVIRLEAGRCV